MKSNAQDVFQENLKALRTHLKATQAAARKHSGPAQNTISSWENGSRKPLEKFIAGAESLGVSPWLLLVPGATGADMVDGRLETLVEAYLSVDDKGKEDIVAMADAQLRLSEAKGSSAPLPASRRGRRHAKGSITKEDVEK